MRTHVQTYLRIDIGSEATMIGTTKIHRKTHWHTHTMLFHERLPACRNTRTAVNVQVSPMYFHPFEMIQQRRHIVGGFLLILLKFFVIFGCVFSVEFVVGWKIWMIAHLRMITGGLRLHNSDLVLENCMVTGRVWQNVLLFFSHPKSMGSGEYIPRFKALQSVQWWVLHWERGNQIQFEHQQKYAFKVWGLMK